MNVSEQQLTALENEFEAFFDACQAPTVRPISQFVCEELYFPSGPRKGELFDFESQPWTRLWLGLVESGDFCRHIVCGPTQTGKTLLCYLAIAMYYLFELMENVGCGIPQMAMAWDKWTRDFLPAIKASRYADQIPDSGIGSKGGKFESIIFKNGASLIFFSANGNDAKRSGATVRILVITEADKFDEASESSREDSPIEQMIARLDAFETLSTKIFIECTVSIETGFIWVNYNEGSAGRIVLQCAYCSEYSTPEREHLVGWKDAVDEIDAREKTHFACPQCGHAWTEHDRREANRTAKLIHKGQTIDKEGVIHGELPRTLTAGFRWNAANNMLRSSADCGGREWTARAKSVTDEVGKSIVQFMWATPARSTEEEQTPLKLEQLITRTHPYGRGVVPDDCTELTLALDLGGWRCHWTAIAWGKRSHGYVIDYGRIDVSRSKLGLELGLMEAMREFRSLSEQGWKRTDGMVMVPEQNLIDSGWMTSTVYEFIHETGLPFRACKGLPIGGKEVVYRRPKTTGNLVVFIGDGWHLVELADDGIVLVEINADQAKTKLHARLNSDITAPGAITFFEIDRLDHEAAEERRNYVRHLTAEKSIQKFEEGRGTVTHWEKIRPDNHWLDSSALALVGGIMNGIEVLTMSGSEVRSEQAVDALAEKIKQILAEDDHQEEAGEQPESSLMVAELPTVPTAAEPVKAGGWKRKQVP